MIEVPEEIGPYRVEAEIGRGGMGVVYRATDSRLGRTVAIKALSAELEQDPGLRARLKREAETLAALSHPNVGGIHGTEEHGGRTFLILEYVDGETLAERVARGPLRIGEALAIGAQIAAGLAAAHDAGVIHRDLKPANVKIASDGTVKVLDFGLARTEPVLGGTEASAPTAIAESLTQAGTVLGTVQYMSPEQARGEPVDRRTDLWALGAVLYESLTGTSPFARSSGAGGLAAVLGEEPDLEALPDGVPEEAVTLVRRCLRKDARERQRDAGDCRLVLEEAREVLSHQASGSSPTARITDRSFRISDELCRTLDRGGFDALLPGWEMRYADNNRDSDVLIVWIPSIGGDHRTSQWRELIAESSSRMVVVTPVGMEPDVESRPIVSIENQFFLIRALTADLRFRLNPKHVIISGVSCGSIMALRCVAGDEDGNLFDGVLAVEPDLQESDCFITRLLAGVDASSARDVMAALTKIGGSCQTLPEWLVLHQHLIEAVGKVTSDFSPLARQGADLAAPYEGVHTGAASPFPEFLRQTLDRARTVRCVFHDGPENRRMLGEIRMLHLDNACLGPAFTDEVLTFLPVPDQIGMMSTLRLLEQLDRIVAQVGEDRVHSATESGSA